MVEAPGNACAFQVFPGSNHAQPGNENDPWIGIKHLLPVPCVSGEILRVVLGVCVNAAAYARAEVRYIFPNRVPLHKERSVLRVNEVIGTGRAPLGERRRVLTIHKVERFSRIVVAQHHALLPAHRAANHRQDVPGNLPPLIVGQRLDPGRPKHTLATGCLVDCALGALYHLPAY